MSDAHLLGVLKHIKEVGPIEESEGLCLNVHYHSRALYNNEMPGMSLVRLVKLFEEWPEGTGTRDYPVPGFFGRGRRDSFMHHKKWSFYGPYGRARWRLVDWMIQQLETPSE